jgi:hypothetical protein
VHNKEITKNNKNAQQRNDEQHHKHTTKKWQKATKAHNKKINEIKINKSTYINKKNMHKDKYKTTRSKNLITTNKKVAK